MVYKYSLYIKIASWGQLTGINTSNSDTDHQMGIWLVVLSGTDFEVAQLLNAESENQNQNCSLFAQKK